MKIETNLLIIFIIVLICLKCCYSNREKEESIRTDTITITQIDTITIIKPQPVIRYRDRIIRDTLYNTDSVLVPVDVPIETKVYQDTNYKVIISGYKAELDSIYIFNKNQIQHINKITYKTKKWNISPSIGVGYGMFGRRIDMYVGFSIGYNF